MREDTRTRIQEIALRLFTEQGYEATSLREIAEELGVTKAALYYHFKTKDDIVAGLADQRVAEIEELLAWFKEQPRTPEARRELLRRYAAQLKRTRFVEVNRFLERNQTAMRDHPKLLRMREAMLELTGQLSVPGDPLATRISRSMALFTLHAGKWLTHDETVSEDEIIEASMEVALRLLEP
ncbi:TetR/AcrR family transcriptional regulator [Nonomuraea cavernae]|uniref:TetR family transcriptional regulator n=1 Tax=Nonomuraea cavernae TaxID=2045107 RepID=A0A917YRU2_9ACTN|nr:TetR/AcrR family transcriptional regulator [Nonomuraea cavernae]GGO63789.1 TetR family transcriptional regulator [Nonomuraea cavernae]